MCKIACRLTCVAGHIYSLWLTNQRLTSDIAAPVGRFSEEAVVVGECIRVECLGKIACGHQDNKLSVSLTLEDYYLIQGDSWISRPHVGTVTLYFQSNDPRADFSLKYHIVYWM